MSYYLKFLMFSAILLIVTSKLVAEQGAWGGNGGWWGGGNREWEGDFDGPGYRRPTYNCHCYHHSSYIYYHHDYDNHNCCQRHPTPINQYYDESIPGAGLYLNLRCR